MPTDKDFEQVIKDCYDETNNALRVNLDAATDLTVTGELTVEQSSNIAGIDVNKTGTGAGNAIEVDNDGTGHGVYIRQDGSARGISIDQNAAQEGIQVNKINVGGGAGILVDNDGTGVGVDIKQDGNAVPLHIRGTYGDRIIVATQNIPATAGATGTQGSICWGTDAGTTYLYICIATDTWERVALATW